MSCYCKELPLDQKAKVEAERPKNLFEEDDGDDDYSETYMNELVNAIKLEDATEMCGSTPSLPEVVVATDRCESKLEIPWLKISLAPPGYYEIKNMGGHPKKVVCDCWNLSANDDVYAEPVETEEEPECTCTSPEEKKKGDVKFEDQTPATTDKDDVEGQKPQSGSASASQSGTAQSGNEANTAQSGQADATPSGDGDAAQSGNATAPQSGNVSAAQSVNENTAQSGGPSATQSKTGSVPQSGKASATQSATGSVPQSGKASATQSATGSVPQSGKASATQSETASATQSGKASAAQSGNVSAAQSGTASATQSGKASAAQSGNVSATQSGNVASNPSGDVKGPGSNIGPKQSQEKSEGAIPQKPSELVRTDDLQETDQDQLQPQNVNSSSSSSSSSVPSTCICIKARDECEDILGKPTAFVFDNPCYAQHEGYLDPLYKLFPDDCDTYCGPHIEMPWSDLTIPRKIKLRQAKKQKQQSLCKCEGDKQEDIVVCGNKEEQLAVPNEEQAVVPYSAVEQADKVDKSFEIQLSFTEIISNIAAVEKKCTPSCVSVTIRPSSKERSSNTESRPGTSSYSCRCGSSKSKQGSSPPQKSRPSKCKNAHCKCPGGRDVSPPMSGSGCKNPNCSNTSPTRKSSRRSPDRTRSPKTSCFQDPVMNVLETCEAEMEPLRDTLNQLKSKIRNLNIPELNNWTSSSVQCSPCISRGPMGMMTSSASMNRPPCIPMPPQNLQHMPRAPPPPPPQFQFPQMFQPMPPPPPMIPPRNCCPQCACREIRPRKRSPRSCSSSTEYSEYDSLSEGESMCPFLRALSSKNVYNKDKDQKAQRRCRTREDKRKPERPSKKSSNCVSKRHNKRSQADYSRQDNCTDTEPEIQVHYGPKHPKLKTKQVFKGIVDPSNGPMSKNQRLRIAVKLTPSGQNLIDENMLAIQGPCGYR